MLEKQLNRRNLNAEQIAYYRGLEYNSKKNNPLSKTENIAEVLAQKHRINEKIIRRDETYALGLEKLDKPLKHEILLGNIKVSKSDIIQLAKIQTPIIQNIEEIEHLISQNKKEDLDTEIEEIKEKIRKLFKQNFTKENCELMIQELK